MKFAGALALLPVCLAWDDWNAMGSGWFADPATSWFGGQQWQPANDQWYIMRPQQKSPYNDDYYGHKEPDLWGTDSYRYTDATSTAASTEEQQFDELVEALEALLTQNTQNWQQDDSWTWMHPQQSWQTAQPIMQWPAADLQADLWTDWDWLSQLAATDNQGYDYHGNDDWYTYDDTDQTTGTEYLSIHTIQHDQDVISSLLNGLSNALEVMFEPQWMTTVTIFVEQIPDMMDTCIPVFMEHCGALLQSDPGAAFDCGVKLLENDEVPKSCLDSMAGPAENIEFLLEPFGVVAEDFMTWIPADITDYIHDRRGYGSSSSSSDDGLDELRPVPGVRNQAPAVTATRVTPTHPKQPSPMKKLAPTKKPAAKPFSERQESTTSLEESTTQESTTEESDSTTEESESISEESESISEESESITEESESNVMDLTEVNWDKLHEHDSVYLTRMCGTFFLRDCEESVGEMNKLIECAVDAAERNRLPYQCEVAIVEVYYSHHARARQEHPGP